jgi:PPOX class probable F420-dependent enzyme
VPKAPLPEPALALLREPNPAVIAVRRPDGHPMSVATWYLVEDDGTILVNMDARRARLGWMKAHPFVSLTALKEGEWYTHISIRGEVVRWEHDKELALADIDRLARHYGGDGFGRPDAERVSAWIRIDHWHGWDLA